LKKVIPIKFEGKEKFIDKEEEKMKPGERTYYRMIEILLQG